MIQPIAQLVNEPGLTQVPRDKWEAWCAGQGKDHPAPISGLIRELRDDAASQRSEVNDLREQKTGLEALDPDKLPEQLEEAPVLGRAPIGSKPVRQD